MSYILDALRKAEQERLHDRQRFPGMSMPSSKPQRRLWPWAAVAGGLLVNAAAIVVVASGSGLGRSAVVVPAVPAPVLEATPGVQSRLDGPETRDAELLDRAVPTTAASAAARVAEPPAVSSPRPRPDPRARASAPVAPARPEPTLPGRPADDLSGAPALGSAPPHGPEMPGVRGRLAGPQMPGARGRLNGPEMKRETTAAGDGVSGGRGAPTGAGGASSVGERGAGGSGAAVGGGGTSGAVENPAVSPESSRIVGTPSDRPPRDPPAPALTESRPTEQHAAARSAGQATPVTPLKPPRAVPPGRSSPAIQDLPRELQDEIPPVRLEVLVYSENAADRFVFINSRKYVEGQRVDGKLTVERIAEDGVILSYQGARFLLRQ